MAGIIETVQRMALMLILVPVVLAGLSLALGGETVVGVGLLAIAVIIYLVSEYVKTPTDVGTEAAEQAASRVVKAPDDEE